MKKPPLTFVWLGLSALITLSSVGMVAASAGRHKCPEVREMVDSLAEGRVHRRDRREALYGEATDGYAWTQYKVAVEAMRAIYDFHRCTQAAAAAETPEEVARRDALLVEARAVLDYLRRGAHCRDATSHVQVGAGHSARIQRRVDVRSIGELAVAQAEALLDAGESVQAVEHLLDAQQMARDLMPSPSSYEVVIAAALLVPASMDRFLEAGGLDRLSVDAVALWLGGVEQLEASLPALDRSFAGDLEMHGWTVLQQLRSSGRLHGRFEAEERSGLAFAASGRHAAVRYMRTAHAIVADVEAAYLLPEIASLDRLQELTKDLEDPSHPRLLSLWPSTVEVAEARAKARTRLRQLRDGLARR